MQYNDYSFFICSMLEKEVLNGSIELDLVEKAINEDNLNILLKNKNKNIDLSSKNDHAYSVMEILKGFLYLTNKEKYKNFQKKTYSQYSSLYTILNNPILHKKNKIELLSNFFNFIKGDFDLAEGLIISTIKDNYFNEVCEYLNKNNIEVPLKKTKENNFVYNYRLKQLNHMENLNSQKDIFDIFVENPTNFQEFHKKKIDFLLLTEKEKDKFFDFLFKNEQELISLPDEGLNNIYYYFKKKEKKDSILKPLVNVLKAFNFDGVNVFDFCLYLTKYFSNKKHSYNLKLYSLLEEIKKEQIEISNLDRISKMFKHTETKEIKNIIVEKLTKEPTYITNFCFESKYSMFSTEYKIEVLKKIPIEEINKYHTKIPLIQYIEILEKLFIDKPLLKKINNIKKPQFKI